MHSAQLYTLTFHEDEINIEYDTKNDIVYTQIIGHKLCSMLSTLNEIALQKEWQHLKTNNVYGPKRKKKHNSNNKTEKQTENISVIG